MLLCPYKTKVNELIWYNQLVIYIGKYMLIDEIKATLALENLYLTEHEIELLKQYAQGTFNIEDLKSLMLKLIDYHKAA